MPSSKAFALAVCALVLVSATAHVAAENKIKNMKVVIMLLENRSFDHMIGMLKGNNSEINGCVQHDTNPACSNPVDPTVPGSPHIYADNEAVYIQPADPEHSVPATQDQTYGFGAVDTSKPAPMDGFIKSYAHVMGNATGGEFIMKCFDPTHVPVITTLASEFTLIDRWFCGVPGPTEVNRAFAGSATSYGYASNTAILEHLGMPQKPIFASLDEFNKTWGIYFSDGPTNIGFQYTWKHLDRYHFLDKFFDDAAAGTLPDLSWVEPAYFDFFSQAATDQHPDHDVAEGEKLIGEVYNALRQGPDWNNTVFLLTYDEHGGFFDHVAPPSSVPNPDGRTSTDPPFNFTRLGVRVPAIIASPWVDAGVVVHSPPAGDGNGKEYCHSSIPATLRKWFAPASPPLTKRSAWAATFDSLLTRDTPRTDCPRAMPHPPPLREMFPESLPPLDGRMPLSPLQRNHIRLLARLVGDWSGTTASDQGWAKIARELSGGARGGAAGLMSEAAMDAMTEGEGAAYVREAFNRLAGRKVLPPVPEEALEMARRP